MSDATTTPQGATGPCTCSRPDSDATITPSPEVDRTGRVTLILPVFNEADAIRTVVLGALSALKEAGHRPSILVVDDGSTDGSQEIIRDLAATHEGLSFVFLSRNFGKEAALMAGIHECGDDFDLLAYMDCDGQHTVEDLLRLIDAARPRDVDLICGARVARDYQSMWQRWMARGFYSLFRKLSRTSIDQGAGDFNVMKPKVV